MNKFKEIVSNLKFLKSRVFIIILLLIVVIASSTFAWYNYTSTKTALVLTIGDIDDVTIEITPYHINETMVPVPSHEDGVLSDVTITNNSSVPKNVYLYYEINNLSNELVNNGLKFTTLLVCRDSDGSGGTEIGSYNTYDFKGHSGSVNIPLESIPYDDEMKSYNTVNAGEVCGLSVWLWLDSNDGDQSNLQNTSLDITLTGYISSNPEAPVLDDGMIPVTIADDGSLVTASESNLGASWYDYDQQEWANVVLVNEDSRSKYIDRTNVIVNQSDVLAYYVWIPRFKYRIPSSKLCKNVDRVNVNQYSECYNYSMSDEDITRLAKYYFGYVDYYDDGELLGVCNEMFDSENPNYDFSEEIDVIKSALESGMVTSSLSLVSFVNDYNNGVDYECLGGTPSSTDITLNSSFSASSEASIDFIDIEFENKEDSMVYGDAINTYYSHPAFWWDYNSNSVVDTGETLAGIWVGKFETSGTVDSPTILPNKEVSAGRYIAEHFSSSLKFAGGTYNSDDGDVSFAGSSVYGLSSDVDSHMMKNSEWGALTYLAHSEYGINNKIDSPPLTDLGGSEYIITGDTGGTGYGEKDIYSQSTTGNISGVFDIGGGYEEMMAIIGTPKFAIDYDTYVTLPASKYYDFYSTTSSSKACNGGVCYGHALVETNGWYGSTGSLGMNNWIFRSDGSGFDYSSLNTYEQDGNPTDIWGSFRSTIVNPDKIYTVTYGCGYVDGVAVECSSISSSQIFVEGENIVLDTNAPTLSGYTFLGWSTDPDDTSTLYAPGDTITSDNTEITLYAMWTYTRYNISYDCNGIDCTGLPAAQSKDDGKTLILSSDIPEATTNTELIFAGWSTIEGATSAMYNAGGEYTTNADATMYAVWEKQPILIYESINGASYNGGEIFWVDDEGFQYWYNDNMPLYVEINEDDNYTFFHYTEGPGFSVWRNGYTHVGWNTKADGSGKEFDVNAVYSYDQLLSYGTDEGDYYRLNIYAQWEVETYTISYNANGGSGTMSSSSCTYGSSCTLTANTFTRLGYTFTGWNTAANGSGTSYIDGYNFDSYTGISGLTLYAQWQQNETKKMYISVDIGLYCRKEPMRDGETEDNKVSLFGCGNYFYGYLYGTVNGYTWYYYPALDCYFQTTDSSGTQNYLSSNTPSCSSSGSSSDSNTALSECDSYCRTNKSGMMGRIPTDSSTCYCCPSYGWVDDPANNSTCVVGY